jgi:hypothetical protein
MFDAKMKPWGHACHTLASMRTTYVLPLLFVYTNLVACDPSGSVTGPAPQSSSVPALPSAVSTTPPALDTVPTAPADLDIKGLQKQLACPAEPKNGPCSVLASFGSCIQWNASTPSGDGRWIGKGYRVEGAKTSDEFVVFRARRMPQNEVGPGQLPLKIGIADISKADGAAFEQADKAIRQFARHDVPPRGNAAVEFLKRKDTWPEGFVNRTAGGQVYVVLEGGAFVCQGTHQQLIVVHRASTRGAKADGLYAEVWPSSW